MPRRRAAPPLEQLCTDALARYVRRLRAAQLAPVCVELRRRLPAPLRQLLAPQLPPPARWLLGARRAAVDTTQLAQLAAPVDGGPRQLSVTAPDWPPAAAPQLVRLVGSCRQLTHLQLTGCATEQLLKTVGSSCPRLVKLSVELALIGDAALARMLGLPPGAVERCLRGAAPAANLPALRQVAFESTLVGAMGQALLLRTLSRLQLCRVSEVDFADVLAIILDEDLESPEAAPPRRMRPQLQLRRLDCRLPLSARQATAAADCCPRVRELCVRGRQSARLDAAMLQPLVALPELSCLQLLDVHGAALLNVLTDERSTLSTRLTQLHLLETRLSGDSLFDSGRLWPALSQCARLSRLQITLADAVAPPPRGVVLPALRQLILEGAPAARLTQPLLLSAPNLEHLHLAPLSCGLTDAAVIELTAGGALSHLRRLEVTNCELSMAGVEALVDHCHELHALIGLPENVLLDLRCRATNNNWALELS